ncbi:hypothetical protein [Marinobacterium rhizophilum]|uniref:hypothetical protein n=1 Tax=Marinobacterium rhizophilum TaxID=420402 RepID=UPI00037C5D22|nr:hypothetical protein [Marinobacterium rhizophilum]
MEPKKKHREPQSDMFKPRLEDIVKPVLPLVCLTAVIDWDRLDAETGQHFATVGASALPTHLRKLLRWFYLAPEKYACWCAIC